MISNHDVRPEAAPITIRGRFKCMQRITAGVTDAVAGFLALNSVMNARRDIDAVRCINHWHLAAINNHSDAACFRESLECFSNVLLKWTEDFLATIGVSSLGIFTLAFDIRVQLGQLISLLPEAIW